MSTRKSRRVILFLAASAAGMSQLAFYEECAAIERELQMTTGRDKFDFRSKWAITVDEVMRHLNDLHPTVIHFSGHGQGRARDLVWETRDVSDCHPGREEGICLQDEQGNPRCITADALKRIIQTAACSARVILLNTCHSGQHADTLRGVVDCVIGMNGTITDDVARGFAVGFYRALGHRCSVGNAVDQAVAVLQARRLCDVDPTTRTAREGMDLQQMFLT